MRVHYSKGGELRTSGVKVIEVFVVLTHLTSRRTLLSCLRLLLLLLVKLFTCLVSRSLGRNARDNTSSRRDASAL